MRSFLIGILLSLALVSANCQESYLQERRESRNKTISTLAIQVGSIALNAAGDALLDRGRHEHNQNMMAWGHTLRAGSVATLLTVPLVIDSKRDVLPFIGSYLFIRAASFDPIYNAIRGIEWNYHGNTNFWDRGWNEVKMPPHGEAFVRSLSLVVGISIQIKYH